jgi:hypothetical protein
MVKIGLQIKANMEFTTGLVPSDPDLFRWELKIKCTQCGEVPDHWQYVSLSEQQPLKGGRGTANYISKCKLCSNQNSLDIKANSICNYDFKDSNRFKTIVVFDCRGLEPVEFSPRDGWKAQGCKENAEDGGIETTSTIFSDVDLSDKEWSDYDEKSGEATVISEFEVNFVTVKD